MGERQVECAPRDGWPGAWTAEAIGDDGEVYQTVFAGPNAERRCREYAATEYGIDPLITDAVPR